MVFVKARENKQNHSMYNAKDLVSASSCWSLLVLTAECQAILHSDIGLICLINIHIK